MGPSGDDSGFLQESRLNLRNLEEVDDINSQKTQKLIDRVIVGRRINFHSTNVIHAPFSDHQATLVEIARIIPKIADHASFSKIKEC